MSGINIEDSITGDGNKRKDPYANVKEVGVFKESKLSGDVGVIDVGDRAKTYIIDLDEIDALTVIGKMSKNNSDLAEIAKMGQDGKRFQNKEIGLIDNETGEVDAELAELIRVAATGESEMIDLVGGGSDKGTTFIEIAIGGRWSTDILRIEGDQLNAVLADLSDLPEICNILPDMVNFDNNASQIAVFDYDDLQSNGGIPKFFNGNDRQVESEAVKAITNNSKMDLSTAVVLAQYAVSAEGQADDGISIDFNGAGVIVSVEAGQDTDTLIFKGDNFYNELATTLFQGNQSIVNFENTNSQIGVFDYDERPNWFIGGGGIVSDILGGGSRMTGEEAEALVALAISGEREGVAYLGGDEDSAVIAVDGRNDTTNIMFISGDEFDFV